MNDGMYWIHKGCKLDKDEFGIIGIQVAVKIPIQLTDGDTVFKFVETLLTIRNILHVNISLLYYTLPTSSSSNTENSSTVSSSSRSTSLPKMKKESL
ncbi:11536_t:CDS:2 [Funneliformis geosporum]|uniref:11536_t:CDS:1 n=1 Tax=Funneliformis geosporum TaxID=1117311 RepID=A0A9W4WTC3_9GLOM|nr:11536_t:CDS:2 [Funneliformis geosporum]